MWNWFWWRKTSKSWIQWDSPCPCGDRAQQTSSVAHVSSWLGGKEENVFNTLLSPTPATHSPHCLDATSDYSPPSTTAVGFLVSNLHHASITITAMLDIMLAKIYIKRPQCSKSPFCWWLGLAVPGKKETNKPKTSKYLCLLLCVCCISGWPTSKQKILLFENKSSCFPNWTFMMGKGETTKNKKCAFQWPHKLS